MRFFARAAGVQGDDAAVRAWYAAAEREAAARRERLILADDANSARAAPVSTPDGQKSGQRD